MQAWEIVSGDGVDALKLNEHETPIPGPGQVRVRLNANSINYRDLITIEGAGSRNLPFPTVPNSDGAGVITAVGEGVTLNEGDRVTLASFQTGSLVKLALLSWLPRWVARVKVSWRKKSFCPKTVLFRHLAA